MADKLRQAAQALIDRWDSPAWGGSAENLRHTGEYIAALRAALDQPALAQQPASRAARFKLVPVEPTPEMRLKGQECLPGGIPGRAAYAADAYRAMVDAALPPNAAPEAQAITSESGSQTCHRASAITSESAPEASVQTSDLEDQLKDALRSLEWHKRRVGLLQQWQSKMRDPERTIVCDILANGQTLEPAGDRYTVKPEGPAAQKEQS